MAATDLTDTQKIAVLLASMDQKIAASVLQQLEPGIMTNVAEAIRTLGVVPGESRNKAIADCLQGIVKMGDVVQGDDNTISSLLRQAIGEKRATAMLQDGSVLTRDAFVNLADVPSEQISGILSREQPSVAAVILRHLPPEKSAEILNSLSSDTRRRAIVLMCTCDPPAPEVVAKIEGYMESQTGQSKKKSTKKAADTDKLDIVSTILQQVDRSIEEELLTAIDDASESLGNEIRDKLFTFEDIIQLSDVAMRQVLQNIDMSLLASALRGASIDVRQKFFKSMSKRASAGLKEEMEYSQKMKRSEVEEKQKEIVNVVRSLEADGQITLGEGKEDEFV